MNYFHDIYDEAAFKENPEGEYNVTDNTESENRELNNHFESAYELKPNENYEVNGYRYETDDHGRVSHCEGSLRLEGGKTNLTHQRKAGGENRLEDDEGGHLIARRFDGSEKVDNIVPMNYHLNRGEYKTLETEWAKDLEQEKNVDVSIDLKYNKDGSQRPDEIRVKYIVTDKNGEEIERKSKSFKNEGSKGDVS